MVRQDLFGGIKNALDRGQSLEEVIKSFVSAGYPEQDVRQAAQALTSGVVPENKPSEKQPQNKQKIKPSWPVQKQQQSSERINSKGLEPAKVSSDQVRPMLKQKKEMPKPKKKMDWKLISLVGVLIILVLVLAGSILFREEITSTFINLFG